MLFTVGVFDGSDHHIHNPINRGMKTGSEETDTAFQVPIHTFCKRAVKVYEYVGVYTFEGFKHQISKAQEAEQVPIDTKREWARAMTTERGWAKDLLRDAGLKVESADFSSFVTKLMNKRYDDALYAALVEEGRKKGEINENGNVDVGSSVPAPSQRRAPRASNARHRQSTGSQRDSERRRSTKAKLRDDSTEDDSTGDDEDSYDYRDEVLPIYPGEIIPTRQMSPREGRKWMATRRRAMHAYYASVGDKDD
ncbi:MAG: hypothetical protein M1815_003172 [Lichina confinis]|nr:MAG: hypothetical protein M1815_003172 [Lichina confinis]